MTSSVQPHRAPIVVGAFLIQFTIIGGVFAFSVFFAALEKELGWSRTILSACTALAFLVMGVFAVAAGYLNDRFGPRWVLSVSGLIYGSGYALLSVVNEPWQAVLIFGVAVGLGMSSHDVVTLSTIARWFSARRGAMTGLVKIGTACGQISVPLIAAVLISQLGWRQSFLVLGIIAMVLLLPAAQLMRGKPVDPNVSTSTNDSTGMRFSEIKRTRQFWTLCAMQFTLFASLMAIPVHIVIHATDLGFSATTAAAVLSGIGAVSILGRLAIGMGIDRLGCKQGYFICFTLLLASLLLLRQITDPHFLFVFAMLYGIAHGGFFTVVSPTIAEYFGMREHGKAFGIVVFFGTLSGASAPLMAGWIFDTYGSYDMAFSILAGLAASGLLLVTTMRAPDAKLVGPHVVE